jgi:hypothetical protein
MTTGGGGSTTTVAGAAGGGMETWPSWNASKAMTIERMRAKMTRAARHAVRAA